jgi:tryptophanyl-tRNA synthetase
MSKSEESGKGVIFLSDSPENARKKIMSATTDSLGIVAYDIVNQPGITNLIDILAALTNKTPEEVTKEYEGQTMYGPLKAATADAVVAFLTDFQAKLGAVDEAKLQAKLAASEEAMNDVASKTLTGVQKAVGLR